MTRNVYKCDDETQVSNSPAHYAYFAPGSCIDSTKFYLRDRANEDVEHWSNSDLTRSIDNIPMYPEDTFTLSAQDVENLSHIDIRATLPDFLDEFYGSDPPAPKKKPAKKKPTAPKNESDNIIMAEKNAQKAVKYNKLVEDELAVIKKLHMSEHDNEYAMVDAKKQKNSKTYYNAPVKTGEIDRKMEAQIMKLHDDYVRLSVELEKVKKSSDAANAKHTAKNESLQQEIKSYKASLGRFVNSFDERLVTAELEKTNLTPEVVEALLMLLYPANHGICIPGDNFKSRVKTKYTAARSIPLFQGKGAVIACPGTQFDTWVTAPGNVTPNGTGATSGILPVHPISGWAGSTSTNKTVPATGLVWDGGNGTGYGVSPSGTSQWVDFLYYLPQIATPAAGQSNSLLFSIPSAVMRGLNLWLLFGDGSQLTIAPGGASQGFQITSNDAAAAPSLANYAYVKINPALPITGFHFAVPADTTTPPFVYTISELYGSASARATDSIVFPASLNTWTLYSSPQLYTYVTNGTGSVSLATYAWSMLNTCTASAINDGGTIINGNVTGSLAYFNSGTTLDQYLSEKTWSRTAAFNKGGYMIYVPPTYIPQVFDLSPVRTPFNFPEGQSLITTIDLTGVSQPYPSAAQMTVVIDGHSGIVGIEQLIPPENEQWDANYLIALSLLQTFYHPMCNPGHWDDLKEMLSGILSKVVSTGKSIIKSPITQDLALKALQGGAELLFSSL